MREILDPDNTCKEAISLDLNILIPLIDNWGVNFCIEDEDGEIPWGLVNYKELKSLDGVEIPSDCGKTYLIKLKNE